MVAPFWTTFTESIETEPYLFKQAPQILLLLSFSGSESSSLEPTYQFFTKLGLLEANWSKIALIKVELGVLSLILIAQDMTRSGSS